MNKQPFWVTITGHSPVCVEAVSHEEACAIASKETGMDAASAKILPYPAEPRIGEKTSCPSFCYRPRECAGRTSCPQSYACSE